MSVSVNVTNSCLASGLPLPIYGALICSPSGHKRNVSALTNQRQTLKSRDRYWPIRGQYSGHVISIGQSEHRANTKCVTTRKNLQILSKRPRAKTKTAGDLTVIRQVGPRFRDNWSAKSRGNLSKWDAENYSQHSLHYREGRVVGVNRRSVHFIMDQQFMRGLGL